MPHKFTKYTCEKCGQESIYAYNGLCSLCKYKERLKKAKKTIIFACSICGSQWNSQVIPTDILAEKITQHMKMQHNEEFVKKVLSSFVKQYRDYDESPVITESQQR